MINILITEEMREKASNWAEKIFKTSTLKNRENYTGLEAQDRYYCGYLGELAFLEYLKREGKQTTYKVKTDGNSDSGDFITVGAITGQPKSVDVKTACKEFHEKIMLPQSQLKKHRRDYYVGVKLVGDEAEIWGYCLANHFMVENYGFNRAEVPTCYKSLKSLTPIDNILKLFKDGIIEEN